MSYEFYKIIHFFGIFSLFFAYGGLVMFYHRNGAKTDKARKFVSMLHGVALFLILLGGFGLVARLGIAFPFPLWIWIKLAVWLALGGLIVLARKKTRPDLAPLPDRRGHRLDRRNRGRLQTGRLSVRFGILTGGGDAPGLNGIIEAVSTTILRQGHEMIGIHDGFEGVFGGRFKKIEMKEINGLHAQAGTFIGTSNKSGIGTRSAEFLEKYAALKLDGLIVAGGDGTFAALSRVAANLPLIAVPKTIDNDLMGTDVTFGYDTACSVVAEAVDALRATAEAHRRIMIVETMGRTAGWIALGGGLASYADAILIPERPYDKLKFLNYLKAKQAEGRRGLVIVCSESARAQGEDPTIAFRVEGSPQPERFGGISELLARWIEKEIGWESRHVVLGHLQRSRAPTTTDRFLTLSMGVKAAGAALAGQWGQAVVYRDGRILMVPIKEILGGTRTVTDDHRWVKLVQSVGLFI